MGASVIPRFWSAPPGIYGQRDTDPAAAFINQALGGLGTARTFALQNRAQRDADTDRQQRVGLALLQGGFAPGQAQPSGTVNAPGVGTIPDFANTPETYQIPGVGAVHRIPTDKDILAGNATTAKRSAQIEVGKQLYQSYGLPGGSDEDYAGAGAAPGAFVAAHKTPPAPKFHIERARNGSAFWVPDEPTSATPTQVPGLNLGAEPEPGTFRPTPQSRGQAEFGTAGLAAFQDRDQVRQTTPGVEEEVGKIVATPTFAKAIPFFHSAEDAARIAAQGGASPAAQHYIRASYSLIDNIGRSRYTGGRVSGPLLQQLWGEVMPSLDVAANDQIRRNVIQNLISAQGQSGYDEDPSYWNKAAKRHGVDQVDLQSLLAGGSRLSDINQRYPQK